MNKTTINTELIYKAVKSSGSGGQHVNKTATKVELYFNIETSKGLSEDEKTKLKNALKNKINTDGILTLSCGQTRSQLKNKTLVTKRFFNLIEAHLVEQKPRIKTKNPKAVKRKRLLNKRINAQKKANRKPPALD